MAVPSDPNVAGVILEGMRAAGQYMTTGTSQSLTDFAANQFQTIKTEIWDNCRKDNLLKQETMLLLSTGIGTVSLPTDFDNEISLRIYDAEDQYRGTAQSGATTFIMLASAFSDSNESMVGRYVFILQGTGSGQYRQIKSYDNTTKVVSMDTDWLTAPASDSQYLIEQSSFELERRDKIYFNELSRRPIRYRRVGMSMTCSPAPERRYPIILTYVPNLTRLDEAGTLFVKHLRERRRLWVQGVKTYTMERYDDARFPHEMQLWQAALARHAANNLQYDRIEQYR